MNLKAFYPMFTTTKLETTKQFYVSLGFRVVFANDFYVHLDWPETQFQLGFLLPDHPSQQPVFQKLYGGQGMFLALETHDVDTLYKRLEFEGHKPLFEPRDEPWGDRHFAVEDPNGVALDFVDPTKRDEMIAAEAAALSA